MHENSFHPMTLLKCATAVLCWFALICSTAIVARAQGWLQHYPSGNAEEPRQLVVAPNGDFVFGGVGFSSDQSRCHFYLQRNDANGNLIWYATIDVNGPLSTPPSGVLNFLERCPGGGFVAGGAIKMNHGNPSEIVFRVSESGDSLWSYMPDPTRYGFLNSAVATPDGNLLVGGTRKVGPPGQVLMTPFLYKLNPADGSVIWSKSYAGNQLPEFGSSVLYAPDGSILQTGLAQDSIFIRYLDAGGNLLRVVGIEALASEYPILRRAESDGFTFIVREAHGNVWFRRYDYAGNLLATKETNNVVFLSGAGAETANGFAFTLTPFADQGPNYLTPALYKMDAGGNIAAPVFPLADFSLGSVYLAQNVKTTPDGGLLFIGANLGQPTWFALKTDSTGHIDGGVLTGQVFRDEDQDCIRQAAEPTLFPVALQATEFFSGAKWHETTDSAGNYAFKIPVGDYDIAVLPPGGAAGVWQPCPPLNGWLQTPGDTVPLPPLGLQPVVDCPLLQLDLGASVFRPCSTTVMAVNVLNAGPADADSSTVMLEADPALAYVGSTASLVAQNGNRFWFDAGPVPALQNVSFSVSFAVDCAAQLDQVICVEGHVSPDSLCAPPDLLWDGAELKVRALCDNDSIRFRVSNVGAGDMGQPSQLVIIEDYIILLSLPLQLPAGLDTLISLPNPDGQTYYGRIRQTPGFPGDAFASDGKDFCTGAGTGGMLLQYPLFAGGPFDARFCDEVRTSFDPNDKRGFPLGYGPSNYIDRGTLIRYLIRFQNTGNDTAFQVTVRDTLPAELDLSTLRIGSASHPFTWELSGAGVLRFHFTGILLPDSTTNEPASHGFVQFSVQPKADLPEGATVHNRAAIYFDFNAPVFTEYAWHTVDSNFIPVHTFTAPQTGLRCSVSPNPAGAVTTLDWEGQLTAGAFPLVLTLSDVLGNCLRQESIYGPAHTLRRDSLPTGLCLIKMEDRNGRVLGLGKVVWMEE